MNEESIFAAALEKQSPAERKAFLDDACRGNADLRAQVEELLSASHAAGSFFEHPPAGLDVTVDAADHETHKPANWDGSLGFLKPCDTPGRIGKLVGNAGEYEIIEVIGSGGMGIVLRAFDTKLSRVVAVKVLAPELARNPTAVKRFLREAKAAAAVVHDHVVTIHNVEETHQPPFLVMQFIDGQTLQQKIDRQGALELKEILRIGCQTAAGLSAAHKHGVIHRDVKPANILLENGIERVKITDFGLARAADDVEITQTGLIAGTPQYMSPEQAKGESMDARSDLFSLGSVLYTMCTGRPAFRADTTMGVIRRVCDDEPRPIREVNAEIPPWLEAIVSKLLAKNPAERFQTAAEVGELLGQHLAHEQNPANVARPATVFLPPPAKPARSRFRIPRDWITFMFVMVFSVVVVLPLVLATVSVMAWFFHRGKDTSSAELPSEARPRITGEWFSDRGEALQLAYAFTADLRGETVDMSGEWNWVDRPTNQPNRLVNARFHQQRRVLESELQSSDGSKVSVVWELGDGGHTLLGKVFKEGRFVRDWNFSRQRPKVSEVISLFNGEDLAGWRAHPESSTAWTVKDKLLVGRGANHYLFSERGDYWDFRLRAEVKVSGDGDGGILVRMAPPAASPGPLSGYEVQIAGDPNHVSPTGTIIRHGASVTTENAVAPGVKGRGDLIRPDQWFNLEISAIGGVLTVSIDGHPVVNYYDDAPRTSGHIALQSFSDTAAVSFRKIEIQELPAGRPRDILVRDEPATATKLYALAAAPGSWTPLFNGQDLDGWLEPTEALGGWQVVDGVLTGQGVYSYLVSKRTNFRDFHLRAEVRINDGGNSGLYFRSELLADWKSRGCIGYEAEISGTEATGKTGSLRSYPQSSVLGQIDEPIVPAGEWFTYEVIAAGNQIATFVNGKLAVSVTDNTHTRGRLALQLLAPDTTVVEFRKIEIKELPAELAWQPLFNGSDLSGWKTHSDQPGNWKVENGILVGSGRVSHLFTERGDYENFHLRFEAKVNAGGDSGVIFRAPFGIKPGWKGPLGFEAQIASKTGTLLEGKNVYGDPSGVPPGTWFTGEVIAADKQIIVRIDGQTTANFEDAERLYTKGHIALQVWHPQTVVQFRKIEIKVLPATSRAAAAEGRPAVTSRSSLVFNGPGASGGDVSVFAIAYSPDGALAATGHYGGSVTVWKLSTGEQVATLAGHERTVSSIAFGSEGKLLATGGEDGLIGLWSTESWEKVAVLTGHAGRIHTLAFCQDDARLVSVSLDFTLDGDNSIRVWDIAARSESSRLNEKADHNTHAAVSRNGTLVAVANAMGRVRLWDLSKQSPEHDFAGFPTSPCSVAFSRDGNRVAAGYLAREASGDWNDVENAVVRLWDVHSGALLQEFHGHAGPVIGLEFSPDDRRLLSLASDRFDSQGKLVKSSDRSIRIWNVETGLEEARIEPSSRANVARWTPQGDAVCTGVRLWNVSARPPESVPKEQTAAVWGPVRDGVQVGVAFKEGKQRYAAGERVKFELKIRNMTDNEKTVEIRRPQDWSVGYAGGDELSLRPVGEKEKLTLAPGEQRVIEPVPPEERGDPAVLFPEKSFAAAANVQIKTDGLAQGFYRVEFLAWVAGKTETLSDPGFGFYVDDGGKPPAWTTGRKAAEGPPNHPELKGVVWGEPVLGLSLGIGPAMDASELADGGMTIYLWNTTSEAIDVQHLEHPAQDWQLVVHDAQGNERRTVPIVGSPKMFTRAHLEPGQVVTPGSTTLKRLWNAGVNPPAKLSQGTYKVTTNFDCRRLDYSHFSLRITSGEAAVEIK